MKHVHITSEDEEYADIRRKNNSTKETKRVKWDGYEHKRT